MIFSTGTQGFRARSAGRQALGLGAVGLLTLGLTGCTGGGSTSDEAEAPAAETTAAPEPGQVSCDFVSPATGGAELTETADAYEVTWTGQEVDPALNQITFTVILTDFGSEESSKPSVQMQVSYVDGELTRYGAVDDQAQLVEATGEPVVSGDTVTGTFPKSLAPLAALQADDFAPDSWVPRVETVETLEGNERETAECTETGQSLPYVPLG